MGQAAFAVMNPIQRVPVWLQVVGGEVRWLCIGASGARDPRFSMRFDHPAER
jgi:hypothetical protein